MSAQLLFNAPTSNAKFDTLLPLFTNNTKQIEMDLISRLNKDLFSTKKNNTNNNIRLIVPQRESIPTPTPSPPRTPKLTGRNTSPNRSNMVTPPPECNEDDDNNNNNKNKNDQREDYSKTEVMTITSKIPLFRRRKTNYINKDATASEKGPVIMKLCNINYAAIIDCDASTSTPTTRKVPGKSSQIAMTIPSTKRRKFRCRECSMGFTTSGHLSRHYKIHTGERNFTCPLEGCTQKFSRHDNCLQHYRTHLKRSQQNNASK